MSRTVLADAMIASDGLPKVDTAEMSTGAGRGWVEVVLERAAEPGGQVLMSRRVPGREELAGLIPYLAGAAARAGAEIRLGVDATLDAVLREGPDAVVLATGARLGHPTIPGILKSLAVDAFEVLRRETGAHRRALVVGGGLLGVGVAHALAARGVAVVVAEAGTELSAELGLRPRWQYVAGLRARPNVTIHLQTTVEPLTARTDGPPVFAVGDCVQPRTAFEAVHEGAALGHRL